MKLLPITALALVASTSIIAPEAQASSRCDDLSSVFYNNSKIITALELHPSHPMVQQQFTIRDEARSRGCPVGSDTLEAEVQNGGVKGNVHRPTNTRQTKMEALCRKWEQAGHIAAVNGKPHFGIRIFMDGGKSTAIERKSETECLQVVRGVAKVTGTKNGNLYNGNTMIGAKNDLAYRLYGSNRSYHNNWTAGAGSRFYR